MVGGIWIHPRRDPLAEVGAIAAARREHLLRVHRFRLRREDLEDCYSQATLELMIRVRHGGRFAGSGHLANALEQRFLSRIHDRRRALAGRSPIQAALEDAHAIGAGEGAVDVADARSQPEQLVLVRAELQRIAELAELLTPDQRLVLATQVALEMPPAAFCERFGWSAEKYRKVAQRARARLRRLLAAAGEGVPGAGPVSEKPSRRPMSTPPPPHGPAAAAAGARAAPWAPDDGRPRISGRAPEPPLPGPAARVGEAHGPAR